MAVPAWIWFTFVFALGCCVGSFLNVVIYRLPRDKSIVTPPSACPACGERIRFYDNVPLVSWLVLGRKCRFCKASISPRYFAVELLTGFVFATLFILYFHTGLRQGLPSFLEGGWLIYLLHIVLLSAFIAASAIDLEYWVIPLAICWFVTAVGLAGSALGGCFIEPSLIRRYALLPVATATTAPLAVGAGIGLGLSWILLTTGLIKRSYESEQTTDIRGSENGNESGGEDRKPASEPEFDHRHESCKEVFFLLPVFLGAIIALLLASKAGPIQSWWADFTRDDFAQHPVIAGFLGSLWGYFAGCGIVWIIRILGTFAFGKEAMGLGDVHLMGAAGVVVGPAFVVMAFFIAPFFGLAWAGTLMFFKKIRQIPYGPFLSMGVFTIIILHDWVLNYLKLVFLYP